MQDQIEGILAHRKRLLANHGRGLGFVAALLLHLLLLATVFLSPTRREPEPLEIVSVNLVPLQALGVRQPRQRPPRPQISKPEPEPEPIEAEPTQPEPVQPEPSPSKPTKAEPAPSDSQPAAPSPASADNPPAQRQGSPRGSAFGASEFGAEVAGIDADFRHDYYVNRMLAMIHSQWVRPAAGDIRSVLTFTVRRNGEIGELELKESSGHHGFDLAATRAIRNASPLLPLPASYRKDTLTVTLIVR